MNGSLQQGDMLSVHNVVYKSEGLARNSITEDYPEVNF